MPVVLLLRLTGEGEIFFLQERVGKNGRLFNLYKFATMLKESPNIGTGTVTMKDDPRILPAGKFLRKTKINELPQLINILFGDMSVVGPRPQAQRCFDAFPDSTQKAIVRVRPGLSGIGSIIFRAEEDILAKSGDTLAFYDKVIAPYKGKVEEWYVENKSLYTYFLVILTTLWVVFWSKSSLVWRLFPEMPPPPEELRAVLNYEQASWTVYYRCAFFMSCTGVLVASLLPSDYVETVQPFAIWDKGQHALAFAFLTVLGLLSFKDRTLYVLLGLSLMGALIECIQGVIGWREREGLDFIADVVGVVVVYGVVRMKLNVMSESKPS